MTNRDTPSDADNPVQTAPTDLARLPSPAGGLGSHDLDARSDDPAVLRQVIERARERLAFYESFDRIIGENIRRSGELMLDTIALREEAQATERALVAREAEREHDRQSERDAMRTLLASLRDEVSAFQTTMTTLANRIDDALRPFEQSPSVAATVPDRTPDPEEAITETNAAPATRTAPAAASSESPTNETASGNLPTPPVTPRSGFRPIRHAIPHTSADPTPATTPVEAETSATTHRTLDLVVSGISRATTALAFQRELGTKPGVVRVETREFAEGVLRLSAEIADEKALSDETFATWTGAGTLSVVTRQPTLIALDLTEA